MAELQKALDKLADQRARLIAHMDAHKALISPLRRLPLDILQEIFLFLKSHILLNAQPVVTASRRGTDLPL
ncbi:hypothetical protein FB451DRAFT_1414535 [Mycena latifolia]|nr:hypothetical protein FB451DRAFT_1414535 [Mycena latifolia]